MKAPEFRTYARLTHARGTLRLKQLHDAGFDHLGFAQVDLFGRSTGFHEFADRDTYEVVPLPSSEVESSLLGAVRLR